MEEAEEEEEEEVEEELKNYLECFDDVASWDAE